jgi:hypothetical protein
MSKVMKVIGLTLLGLVLWMIFVYLAFVFVQAEVNPFAWSMDSRIILCGITCIYIGFIPAIAFTLRCELK